MHDMLIPNDTDQSGLHVWDCTT